MTWTGAPGSPTHQRRRSCSTPASGSRRAEASRRPKCASRALAERALDLRTEARRIDGRIAEELGLDRLELHHEGTAVALVRELGDEVGRRRELDVDVELFVEVGDPAQKLVGARLQSEIDVEGRRAPAFEDRCRPSGQVEARVCSRGASEPSQQRSDAGGVSPLPHARQPGRSSPCARQGRCRRRGRRGGSAGARRS